MLHMHMNGLKAIIAMRGGIQTLDSNDVVRNSLYWQALSLHFFVSIYAYGLAQTNLYQASYTSNPSYLYLLKTMAAKSKQSLD